MENSILSKILKERREASFEQRKALITAHIELVKGCNDQEELSEIVKCRDLDIAIRKTAAEKITDEVYLNYLGFTLTLGIDDDNVELILNITSRVKDKDVVQSVMEDVLLGHISYFREDLFEKVLAKVNSIAILEKFIAKEEKKHKDSQWSKKAYERAMQLFESE